MTFSFEGFWKAQREDGGEWRSGLMFASTTGFEAKTSCLENRGTAAELDVVDAVIGAEFS